MQKILLASKSPRRAELLTQMDVSFELASVDVPEQQAPQEAPKDYVLRLAQQKAQAGAKQYASALCPVLGADTLIEFDNRVLEKPKNAEHGAQMLALLSNNTHQVHTAVAVCQGNTLVAEVVTSDVTFRAITPDEAWAYWQTGEPCDKAGGYGIQGLGGVFVTHLAGSYSGVMGLPVAQTQQLLQHFNIACWQRLTRE